MKKMIVFLILSFSFSCDNNEKIDDNYIEYKKIIYILQKDCSFFQEYNQGLDSIIFFEDSIKFIAYDEEIIELDSGRTTLKSTRIGDTTFIFNQTELQNILIKFDFDKFFGINELNKDEGEGADSFIVIEKGNQSNGLCYNYKTLNPWIDPLLIYINEIYNRDFNKFVISKTN